MKAVDYLKAKARMAKYHCSELERERPEKAVEIVGKWAKEHPVKTYLSVLLEKLPNTKLYEGSYPKFCPHTVFNINEKCPSLNTNCKDCWNREYKEEE